MGRVSTLVVNSAVIEEFNRALAQGIVLGDFTPDNDCDGPRPTEEGDTMMHRFSVVNRDDLRCKFCDGYPFDFQHWCWG